MCICALETGPRHSDLNTKEQRRKEEMNMNNIPPDLPTEENREPEKSWAPGIEGAGGDNFGQSPLKIACNWDSTIRRLFQYCTSPPSALTLKTALSNTNRLTGRRTIENRAKVRSSGASSLTLYPCSRACLMPFTE